MKKIQRNLSLNNTYEFISITDSGDGNYSQCNNCGRPIRYIVELKDVNNKIYYVGTECSKTLQECSITNEYSLLETMVEFKKVAAAKNFIKSAKHLKFYGYKYEKNDTSIEIIGVTPKGIVKRLYIKSTFDTYKQSHYCFIESFLQDIYNNKEIQKDWCYNDLFVYKDKLKKQYKK